MLNILAFSKYIKIITAMTIAFCNQVDTPKNLKQCEVEIVECVLDGESIEFCGGFYIEEKRRWNSKY